eukprot:scaffold68906_cov63-Phaeocystis_antarctica.AAC.2
MIAHTTKQLTLATPRRDQQDPMPSPNERATARSAMWPEHVQEVGTERACATGPSLAPRHTCDHRHSVGQLYPRAPSVPPRNRASPGRPARPPPTSSLTPAPLRARQPRPAAPSILT